MEEKFLDILGNIWGTDIAYQESQEQIDLIMKAMTKAYELGNKTNDIHSVSESSLEDKLYNKCLEGMPDITKEEFEEALNTWLHQYTKSKQIENFNPHSR